MKKFMKKYRNYFIIALTVLIVILITNGFCNIFGSDTDYLNQHTIIPEYFRQLFYQTGNILPNFAFNFGGGQNIFNLSYYGLLSPIVMLSYLFPFLDMVTYMTIVDVLIVIVSGILFYEWLRRHNFNDNISLLSALIFVLAEPLIFHMHRHIMFVNYMPFLIMAMMGVDKLIRNNQKTLLITSIFLMIMTSYYYSVGGIIVIGIYYIYMYLNNQSKFNTKVFFKDGFKFIGFVLVGILMSAVLLFPTFYTLFSGRGEANGTISLVSLFIPKLNIHDIFCGTYAIGLSLLSFVSLFYLFYTKKKNNIILGVILSLILFIPIFRYILNGGLYLREKCFIPFVPLFGYLIAYFINDIFNNKINIKKFCICLTVIFVIFWIFNLKELSYLYLVWLVISLFIFSKIKSKKIMAISLLLPAFGIVIGANFNEDYVSISQYKEIFDSNTEDKINKIISDDDSYFRMNNLDYPTKTINKIYDINYLSTNIYSSTYNNNYLKFVRNVSKNSMLEYNYFMVPSSNNLLFNTFMGVKYLYSSYDPGLGYELVSDNVYVNENVFPLIYASNNIMSEEEFEQYDYPYQMEVLLNNVVIDGNSSNAKYGTYIKETHLNYEVIEETGIVMRDTDDGLVIDVEEDGYIRLKLDEELINKILFIDIAGLKENSCSYDNISLKINNVENILTCKSWIYANKNNVFRYVISDDTISELKIHLSKGTYNISDVRYYVLDYDDIKYIKDSKTAFNIVEMGNDEIVGNIDVLNDSYFVTSIPYDDGFAVMVNGDEVSYEMVNKGFIGFPLKKGSYNISITYKSPLLKEGKIISLVGLLIFVLVVICDIRNRGKIKKVEV